MDRRTALALLGLAASRPALAASGASPAPTPRTKPIPSTGQAIPVVGLGTWITFNVGRDPQGRKQSTEVMRAFFAAGGRVVDSSPMYGSSQSVVGEALQALGRPAALFSADKVWTSSDGAQQVEASRQLWGVPRFDLLQVHNLLSWQDQLPLLQKMKEAGRVRYVGITTSEGRRHGDFEKLMAEHRLDFVQLTYNPADREAERRLLPLARERGIAVLANRPFQEGALLERVRRQALPAWAADLQCTTWAQLVLKFIVSHPAVTCAIPATTSVVHVRENLAAASGPMPDDAGRRRIAALFDKL